MTDTPTPTQQHIEAVGNALVTLERLATHVRPTCTELYDEAAAALARVRKVSAIESSPRVSDSVLEALRFSMASCKSNCMAQVSPAALAEVLSYLESQQ